MFTTPFPSAFGVDIGDRSIKVVQLRNVSRRHGSQSFEPVVIRRTTIPPGLIVNGVIQESEKVRKYLLHLLEGARPSERRISSHWVVASLPDVQGFLKRIDIEKPHEDIIDEDVYSAAKRHIPFEENDYYIDWQVMPTEEKQNISSILVAATPRKNADMYTHLLESVGLGVIALEIETVAMARSLITASKDYEHEARAILDLGAARSSVTVFDHDQIQYSLSLPFSGDRITEKISEMCHLSYEEAEAKKIQTGLEYMRDNEPCWNSVGESANELALEVQTAINFYYSHFSNTNKITHITMCGGGAAMKRLDRLLSLKLKITARPGNVWKNLSLNKKPPLDEINSLEYAAAIGLALRAAANPFFTRDLL